MCREDEPKSVRILSANSYRKGLTEMAAGVTILSAQHSTAQPSSALFFPVKPKTEEMIKAYSVRFTTGGMRLFAFGYKKII